MDEKTFFHEIHSFMRERRTPISRMPTLGFKESTLVEIICDLSSVYLLDVCFLL